MNYNDAKLKIENVLEQVKEIFSNTDVEVQTGVETEIAPEKENGKDELTDVYGFVEIKAEGMKEDDSLCFYLDVETDPDENINEEKLNADSENLISKMTDLQVRLDSSENINDEIILIGKEIDDKLKAQLDATNMSIKKNLYVAATAALIMLIIAVLAILAKKFI